MKVRFWGTRGSIPVPGKGTVRYGGNTPCVEVRPRDGELLIFDAGTGIRALGDSLLEGPGPLRGSIAITHPHWDHIQGFPFFRPLFLDGNEFVIIGPESDRFTLRQVIADVMNKVYFPIHLNELKARVSFAPMAEETREFAGWQLSACYVNHPAAALGYRVDAGEKSLVYISDNEPFSQEASPDAGNIDPMLRDRISTQGGDANRRIFDFARNTDILIHDASYTLEEFQDHLGWGHSPFAFALHVAREAGARKLILFHHDPRRDDAAVDEILRQSLAEMKAAQDRFECIAAAEGMVLEW